MKKLLLLTFSFSILLARVGSAEDQNQNQDLGKDKPKQPKSHIQATHPPQHVVPPHPAAQPPHLNRNPAQTNPYHPKAQTTVPAQNNPTLSKHQVENTTKVPGLPYPVGAGQSNDPAGNPADRRNWQNPNRNHNRTWNPGWEEARRRHHQHHHHDRQWWISHYTRFALCGTGYFFWDAGYWYPAYGYDPVYNTYDYNEPIYAYNDLDPAEIVASVQTELQRLGYYPYAVDGQMGPMTRAALANYQRDNDLEITSAIDEPTLQSLGLE
jgi:hypothetical protein